MFIMLIRNNFKDYFVRKDEIKATISNELVSILLAFISPGLSMASFLLVLVLRFIIRMSRGAKDPLDDIELSDDEKEFVDNVRNNIYGEE